MNYDTQVIYGSGAKWRVERYGYVLKMLANGREVEVLRPRPGMRPAEKFRVVLMNPHDAEYAKCEVALPWSGDFERAYRWQFGFGLGEGPAGIEKTHGFRDFASRMGENRLSKLAYVLYEAKRALVAQFESEREA